MHKTSCQKEYGSCPNFEEYPFQVHEQTSHATLRSAHLQEDESINNNADDTNFYDFIFPISVIVVPAAETSNNTVWFIKVVSTEFSGDNRANDDCGNIILPHTAYFA